MNIFFRKAICLSLMGVFLLSARSAEAAADSCSSLKVHIRGAVESYGTLNRGLPASIRSLKDLEAFVEAMIEAERIAEDGIEMTDEVIRYSKEIGPVTEVFPPAHRTLNTVEKVFEEIKKLVLKPVEGVLRSAVVAPRLKHNLPRIKKLRMRLEKLEGPVKKASYVVGAYKLVVEDDCAKAEGSEDAKISAKNAEIVHSSQKLISDTTRDIKDINHAVDAIHNALRHDVLKAIEPFKKIEKPIHKMYDVAKDLHHGIVDFRHALHHTIHVKIAGATVAKFSVHEVLHDYKKIVHTLEHDLHIDDARKWLEKELNKILHPVIRSIMRPVRRVEHKAKVTTKDFARDAKASFERFESKFEQTFDIKLDNDAIDRYADQMKALAEKS